MNIRYPIYEGVYRILTVDCSDNLDIRIIQEKERIRNLLDKNHGNVSKTAAELGCSRTSLYKKMKKLDLK